MDHRIVYIGAQSIFCILFIVLFLLQRVNRKGQKLNKLDFVYFLFIATIILDCIWMVIDGKQGYITGHIVLQLFYLSAMSLTGYTWFLYTLDLFPARTLRIRRYRYILGIPVLIGIFLVFVSIKTNWFFEVDQYGTYHRGSLYLYPILLNYIYMLMGSFIAIKCRNEALLTIDKRRYTVAALFPLPVLLLSALQIILPPGLPTMQGGVLVALLLLYGTSQNDLISRDYLTGLPNRVAFERDLMERIGKIGNNESVHLYLLEGDLDKFKMINDTYGHPAGDRALLHSASALSIVFSPYSSVVFRTGGDEFMIVCETEKTLDIDALRAELNDMLSQEKNPDHIPLSMSLGLEEYDGKSDIRGFIEQVDRKLYESKKS